MDGSLLYGGSSRPSTSHNDSSESELSEGVGSSDESEFASLSDSSSDDDVMQNEEEMPQNEEYDNVKLNWKRANFSSQSFSFSGQERLNCRAAPAEDGKIWPIDIYNQFLTENIINLIVVETNKYADQVLDLCVITKKSKFQKWNPTSCDEIRKFLGIILLMSLDVKPRVSDYWSKSKLHDNNLIRSIMDQKRFQILLNMIHFSDNTLPFRVRHQKIATLISLILTQFQLVYSPGSNLMINETIIPFRGKILSPVTDKSGMRLVKLCTLDGYTLNFKIYSKKEMNEVLLMHSESIVMKLMSHFLDKGMTLYTNSFHPSINLAKLLLRHKIYICGTANPNNKEFPKAIKKSKLEKGEVIGMEDDRGIKVFNFKSRRNIYLLSTVPEHSEQLIASGKVSENSTETKMPNCILDYQNAKKSIKYLNELSSYYIIRKKIKWYKKVALELLTGTCVVNAWLLYNKYYTSKKWSFLKFKESLVLSLLLGISREKMKPKKPLKMVSEGLGHCLEEVQGPKSKTRKRCRGCYEILAQDKGSQEASKKAKKVSTYCSKCPERPYLCLLCFKIKHNL